MIEVSHLSKKYGTHPAIEDLSFTVGDGQIFGLLRPEWRGQVYDHEHHHRLPCAPTSGEVKVAGFQPAGAGPAGQRPVWAICPSSRRSTRK